LRYRWQREPKQPHQSAPAACQHSTPTISYACGPHCGICALRLSFLSPRLSPAIPVHAWLLAAEGTAFTSAGGVVSTSGGADSTPVSTTTSSGVSGGDLPQEGNLSASLCAVGCCQQRVLAMLCTSMEIKSIPIGACWPSLYQTVTCPHLRTNYIDSQPCSPHAFLVPVCRRRPRRLGLPAAVGVSDTWRDQRLIQHCWHRLCKCHLDSRPWRSHHLHHPERPGHDFSDHGSADDWRTHLLLFQLSSGEATPGGGACCVASVGGFLSQ
jgi:hypothetical protein